MANTAPTPEFTPDPAHGAAPIGHIETLTGSVRIYRADGMVSTLEVGHPVYQGDELVTGPDAAVGLILADQTAFSMAENGRISLDEMVYDPGSQEGSIGLSIGEGIFTFISGEIAKTDPEAMLIDTPVATIGIRGTQLGVDIADGENLVVVMMEEAGGFVGEAVIRNDLGVQVLNAAHQGTTVAGLNAAPGAIYQLQPAQILQQFGATFGHLPHTGDANPYGVEATAVEALAEEELAEEPLAEEILEEEIPADEEVPAEEAAVPEEAEATDEEELADFETAAGEAEAETPAETIKVVAEDYVLGETEIEAIPTPVMTPTATGGTATTTGIPRPPPETRHDETVVPPEAAEPIVETGDVADQPTLEVSDVSFGTDLLPGDDNIKGRPEDDVLYGGGGADTIDGKAGDDIIYGEGGQTTVALDISAALADTDGSEILSIAISGLPGGASLSAGTEANGIWTLGSEDLAGLSITLPEGYAEGFQLAVEATATESGEEETASTTANINVSYTGSAPGDDALKGGAGDDVLFGGSGDDQLRGEGGDDVLYGGAGEDTLKGEGGDDILYGGTGDDELTGSGGVDTFVFEANSGSDTITDYKNGEELRFEGSAFSENDIVVAPNGDHAVITFGSQNVEVTVNNTALTDMSYTVTQEADAVVVVFGEVD